MPEETKQTTPARLPPHDTRAEQSVLGAMMTSRDSLEQVIRTIGTRAVERNPFFLASHATIYAAAAELYAEGEVVDSLTVRNRLERKGELDTVGGDAYLIELTGAVAGHEGVGAHCAIILDKYVGREAIRIGEDLQEGLSRGRVDTLTLLEAKGEELLTLRTAGQRKAHILSMTEALETASARLNAQSSAPGIYGITSGLSDLDAYTDGWQKSDLIILAARPSQGKTALAIHETLAAALNRSPVGFFSLEMSAFSLVVRMLANLSEIDSKLINKLRFEQDEFTRFYEAVDQLEALPIYIDETPAITPMEFRSKATEMVRRYGVELLVVDYLQLMQCGVRQPSRDREVGFITGSLKAVAKELDVPVIALSQLNRGIESRGGAKGEEKQAARPQLSDLRESGNIEQDADVVLFPWNPNPVSGQNFGKLGEPYKLIVAKQRNGEANVMVDVRFVKCLSKFISGALI